MKIKSLVLVAIFPFCCTFVSAINIEKGQIEINPENVHTVFEGLQNQMGNIKGKAKKHAEFLLSAVKRFDEDYKAFNVRLPIYEKNIRPKVVGDASLEKYERILKEI